MQITDKKVEDAIVPLFRLAFRPFFWGGALFSIVALMVWGGYLSGNVELSLYGHPFWWHTHEMLFGFGGAFIVGFLLTAVQTWTGLPGIRSWRLVGLFLLWLTPRIGMLVSSVPQLWIACFDLAWMPIAAFVLGRPVLAVKGWRNLFFVPLLLLMTLLNGQMHYAVFQDDYALGMLTAYNTLLTITILMLVMGGRVIPFFTARKLGFTQAKRYRWLELSALAPLWLVLFISLFQVPVSNVVNGTLLVCASILNLIRFLRWKPLKTFSVPLLWSLHLAYSFIILGLFTLGLSYLVDVNDVIALHFLAIGGMGGLILAMISRVTLGHTGRTLDLPGGFMVFALGFPAVSALIRAVMPEIFPVNLVTWYLLSILFWVMAYGAYLYFYGVMLLSPRTDNRPG